MIIFEKSQAKTFSQLLGAELLNFTGRKFKDNELRELVALLCHCNSYNHFVHELSQSPVYITDDLDSIAGAAFISELYDVHKIDLNDEQVARLHRLVATEQIDLIPAIDIQTDYIFSHFHIVSINDALAQAKEFLELQARETPETLQDNDIEDLDYLDDYSDGALSQWLYKAFHAQTDFPEEQLEKLFDQLFAKWKQDNHDYVAKVTAVFKSRHRKYRTRELLSLGAGIMFNAFPLTEIEQSHEEAFKVLSERFSPRAWMGVWRVPPVDTQLWEEGQPSTLIVSQTTYMGVWDNNHWHFLGMANGESFVVGGPHYIEQNHGGFETYFEFECEYDSTITLVNQCRNELDCMDVDVLMAEFLLGEFNFAGVYEDVDGFQQAATNVNLPWIERAGLVMCHITRPEPKDNVVNFMDIFTDRTLSDDERLPMPMTEQQTKQKEAGLEFFARLKERCSQFQVPVHAFDPLKYPDY